MNFDKHVTLCLMLGTITRANKTKEDKGLSKIGIIIGWENGCEFYNRTNESSSRYFQFSRTGNRVFTVIQLNHTSKWVMSAWTRRFDNPDEISGLEVSF